MRVLFQKKCRICMYTKHMGKAYVVLHNPIYIYIYKVLSFEFCLMSAQAQNSDGHIESMQPLYFFNLCILSSATRALSTLCLGRLYPHIHLQIYIYIYIYIYIHTYMYVCMLIYINISTFSLYMYIVKYIYTYIYVHF